MTFELRIETPKSLTQTIIDRLERAIVEGEIGLGDMISEETLAKSFGVSRTPVRDALSALAATGLVVVLNKKGSFVFRPTLEDAATLCEYRLILELQGLRLSHTRARDATLTVLRDAIAEMDRASTGDPVAYGRADSRFHSGLLAHCGNSYLIDAYRLAAGKVAALRTHLTARSRERRETSYQEHRHLADLFASGDLTGFEAVLTDHIDRTRKVYVDALTEAPPRPRAIALKQGFQP